MNCNEVLSWYGVCVCFDSRTYLCLSFRNHDRAKRSSVLIVCEYLEVFKCILESVFVFFEFVHVWHTFGERSQGHTVSLHAALFSTPLRTDRYDDVEARTVLRDSHDTPIDPWDVQQHLLMTIDATSSISQHPHSIASKIPMKLQTSWRF